MFNQARLWESQRAASDVYTRNATLNGKYKGYVIDRLDKYGTGRVKVHIPELMIDLKPNKDGIWALPRYHIQGQHLPPWYNEWVQIEFDNGDPNKPYYLATIKHLDDAIWEMNEKNGVPEKDPQHDHVYKNYGCCKLKCCKLIPPHIEAASKAHVTVKTPIMAHYEVHQDDKDLNFKESRSGLKQVRVLNDHEKYNYSRTEKEYEHMMHERDEYIEMNTPDKYEYRFDNKNKYMKFSSKNKNFLIINDNDDSVMIGTKEKGSQFINHKQERICSDKSKVKAKYDVWHKKRKVSDDKFGLFPTTYTDFVGNNVCCVSSQKFVRINSFDAMSIHDGNTGYICLNPHK